MAENAVYKIPLFIGMLNDDIFSTARAGNLAAIGYVSLKWDFESVAA